MIYSTDKVKSREDFFEYLSGYMDAGDIIKCECVDEDSDTLEFTLISPCGYPLVGYRTDSGVINYK